jgi:hypothetical protein
MDTGRLQSLDISGQISKKAYVNPYPMPRQPDSQLRRQESLQVKRRKTARQIYLQLGSVIRKGLFENVQCVNKFHTTPECLTSEEIRGPTDIGFLKHAKCVPVTVMIG